MTLSYFFSYLHRIASHFYLGLQARNLENGKSENNSIYSWVAILCNTFWSVILCKFYSFLSNNIELQSLVCISCKSYLSVVLVPAGYASQYWKIVTEKWFWYHQKEHSLLILSNFFQLCLFYNFIEKMGKNWLACISCSE